jgi:hypothetical protein
VKERIDKHIILRQIVFVGFKDDLTRAFERAVDEAFTVGQ